MHYLVKKHQIGKVKKKFCNLRNMGMELEREEEKESQVNELEDK